MERVSRAKGTVHVCGHKSASRLSLLFSMSILVRTGLKMETSVMEMASMATEKVTTQPDKKKWGNKRIPPWATHLSPPLVRLPCN